MEVAGQTIGARQSSLNDIVRDEILRRILSGELSPGARLVETSIAQALGVSRAPVRAAIRELELAGFVVAYPRRGASVATASTTEALACYEVRTVLEGLAASLAASRRSAADLDRMRAVIAEGDEALRAKDWDQLSQLNNDFHVALAVASGNAQLVQLMQQYSRRIAWMFSRSAEQRGAVAWEEHANIVEAVSRREPQRAAAEACAHIHGSREQFILCSPPTVIGESSPASDLLP